MKNKLLPIVLVAPFALTGCKTIKLDDVLKYEETLQKCRDESDFHTELYIFPENIQKNRIKKFRYQWTEGLFTASFLFYLVYEWDDDYDEEINRISQVKAVFKDRGEKSVLHYEKEKMFVTIYNEDGCRYEFAKYDSSKKIISYTSNQLYQWDEIGMQKPNKITIPKELLDWKEFYNMYYFYEGDVGYYVED